MAEPTTAREALLHEMYGDLIRLVDRMDELKVALPATADATSAQIAESGNAVSEQVTFAGRTAATSIAQAGKVLLDQMAKEREAWSASARDAKAAAHLVSGATNKIAWAAVGLGLAGGVIGGCLAGLALARLAAGGG